MEPAAAVAASTATATGGLRVLVAEDNEDHLFLTVRALHDVEGVQLEVEAVRDGAEALDFVHRRGRFEGRARPHLIVLDLKMPVVDGFDVLASLKADPELRRIPVVVLTSSERPEDVQLAFRLGTNAYVTKGASTGGLRERLMGLSRFWLVDSVLPEPPNPAPGS